MDRRPSDRHPEAAVDVESPADADRRRALQRMKATATGLLVMVSLVYIVVRPHEGRTFWGYVSAFAEAAMVGALADWFAVTALFRHPLGIPIPHTAIIPTRKDQIGRSLGEFVQGNFLSEEVIRERMTRAGVLVRVGDWLADPEHAARTADRIAELASRALELTDDEELRSVVREMGLRRLAAAEVAPLLGRVTELAIDDETHFDRLFDSVLRGTSNWLRDNRVTLRGRLDQESPWWMPERVDDRIFDKLYNGAQRFIDDVLADPLHEVRRSVRLRVRELADRLQHDDDTARKVAEVQRSILDQPAVQEWLSTLWDRIKRQLQRALAGDDAETADIDLDTERSELRARLASIVARGGVRLRDDDELRDRLQGVLDRGIASGIRRYGSEVGAVIEATVAKWDGPATSRRLELQVGRDLQFIRINGTIVGGLAGVVIHAITQLA